MALSRLRDYPLPAVWRRLRPCTGWDAFIGDREVYLHYRLIGDDIVIYRVADGRRDYPGLFKKMK